jgi:hypothetical protein
MANLCTIENYLPQLTVFLNKQLLSEESVRLSLLKNTAPQDLIIKKKLIQVLPTKYEIFSSLITDIKIVRRLTKSKITCCYQN